MSFFDGKHGVLADSLSVSWQNVRDVLGVQPGPARFSGPRVAPDVGPLSTGRDWTLYELIDRTQILADNTRTVRTLLTTGLELQFGRGRVFDAPYMPDCNVQLAPGRAPAVVGGNNIPSRNRVTSFRATVTDAAIRCVADEIINDPTQPPIYPLDNYRAYIVEGRPVLQRRPDYCFISALAELDVPLTFAGFGQFLTPVPDYAVALSIDLPLAVTANCGIAWVDVFGTRFPASAAAFAQAPICVGRNEFTVPWWASAFHIFQNGAAILSPVQCTWTLLV